MNYDLKPYQPETTFDNTSQNDDYIAFVKFNVLRVD